MRLAENIIDEKTESLELAEINTKAAEAKVLYEESRLDSLKGLEKIEVGASIQRFALDYRRHSKLKRDAEFELQVALKMKARILKQNPQLASLEYEEMQNQLSYEAYVNNLADNLIGDVLERAINVPQSVVELNLSSDTELIAEVQQAIALKLTSLDQKLPQSIKLFKNHEFRSSA